MTAPPPPVTTRQRSIGIRTPPPLVPRMLYYAIPGFGKTTFGATAPDPVIVMAPDERGYDTLARSGLVPTVPSVIVSDWADLMKTTDLIKADKPKTAVFDAVGGLERLAMEHVCKTEFNGDWGNKKGGYRFYGQGNARMADEWLKFLARLDSLSFAGIGVVLLGHAKVKTFDDPAQDAKFDRYVCDCHEKVWDATSRWCEAILFGKFETIVDKDAGAFKAKGIGGTKRIVYASHRDAYDAKNQYGMPDAMEMSGDPAKAWSDIWAHARGGSK